jgi:hypothetical protein
VARSRRIPARRSGGSRRWMAAACTAVAGELHRWQSRGGRRVEDTGGSEEEEEREQVQVPLGKLKILTDIEIK